MFLKTQGLHLRLGLRLVFLCLYEVIFITWQLRYLFVWYNYDFYDVRITLYLGTLELRMEVTLKLRFIFFVIVMYLFLHRNYVIMFFTTLELRFILIRSKYVWKKRCNYV